MGALRNRDFYSTSTNVDNRRLGSYTERLGSWLDNVETALRVLVAWMEGREPVAADIGLLKAVRPAMAHLPVGELACQVIRDLNTVGLKETERNHLGYGKVGRAA